MRPIHTARVHFFETSRDAYDACQCDESIGPNDVLVIPSEGVVGLAGTWPVAVTVKYGGLHMKSPTELWLDHYPHPNLIVAVRIAVSYGFEVDARDGEVLGTDTDGGDICWCPDQELKLYNCGAPE